MKVFFALLIAVIAAVGTSVLLMVRGGFSTRTEPSYPEKVIATKLRDWSIPSRYEQLRNPVECSEEVLTEARAHWADHCATCHANDGGGDTMLGRGMYPKPPDMRRDTQNASDGEIYYTIKNGVRLSGMPAFGAPGDNDEDSWKLVCFVRHLPKMTANEELQMRKLNPKTPEELEEERQEEEFLNGGADPPQPKPHHHQQ